MSLGLPGDVRVTRVAAGHAYIITHLRRFQRRI